MASSSSARVATTLARRTAAAAVASTSTTPAATASLSGAEGRRRAASATAARAASASTSIASQRRIAAVSSALLHPSLPPAAASPSRHFSSSPHARQQQQQQQQQQEQPKSDQKQDNGKQQEQQQKKGGGGGGDGAGDGIIRSPFQAFVDTLRTELQKSREMQEGMSALQGEVGKAQDSETMRAARETYERMMLRVSLQENPRLRAAAERLRKDGGKVSEAVAATLKQMEESELIKGLSNTSTWLARQLADSTAPIRQTEAYRAFSETILEALDDGASAIRIYASKDEDAKALRARKRAVRLQRIGRSPPAVEDVEDEKYWIERDRIKAVRKAEEEAEEIRAAAAAAAEAEGTEEGAQPQSAEGATEATPPKQNTSSPAAEEPQPIEKTPPPPPPSGFALQDPLVARVNPKAGSALVAVEGSSSDEASSAWSRFKSFLPFQDRLAAIKEAYGESENPVVERVRSFNDTVKSWLFDENETAAAIRLFRRVEPSFTMDGFQRQLREYIAPELVDAMHSANRVVLKQWCSERTYNVVLAQIENILKEPGARMVGNLLDIRSIDVVQGRLMDSVDALDIDGHMPVLVVRWETTELLYFTSSNPKRIAEFEAAEAAKRKARADKANAARGNKAGSQGASLDAKTAESSKAAAPEAATKASSSSSSSSTTTTTTPATDAAPAPPKEVVIGGSKDRAETCVYVAVLMRNEKDTDNVLTGGWKVIELIRRSEGAFL